MNDSHQHDLRPSRFLVENLHLLPRGRVLDVAMGYGRNAVFLACSGFEVEGVDILPEAVAGTLEAARKAGVDLMARVADLEEGHYSIPREAYDVIICFNYLHRPLIPTIKQGLRLGGMVVYEIFLVDQARFGRPKNPDHLLGHNELLLMFRDFRCLRYHEGEMETGRAVAGIIAQKECDASGARPGRPGTYT
ncbi:MAG: methyltransferase domain-containing protein [Desulfobacterales bacterium]|nr:methyltransferase domain-containing protein [Desulfobacterales bacterium]